MHHFKQRPEIQVVIQATSSCYRRQPSWVLSSGSSCRQRNRNFPLWCSPATAKPCGGAIPLCMLDEFSIPSHLIDRRVTEMRIVSPSNLIVDFREKPLNPMSSSPCSGEVLDSFLGSVPNLGSATLLKALVTNLVVPTSSREPARHSLHHGQLPASARQDQNCPRTKWDYENLAEMYMRMTCHRFFTPRCSRNATTWQWGLLQSAQAHIKSFQHGIRARVRSKIEGGKVIKVEAHPIPERLFGSGSWAGRFDRGCGRIRDKMFGRGIYFAAKSGRMCGKQS
ncbi:hypothetical protein HAX54_001710 [Datura stramonium]|uniref:Uncharacterized protein n=1 Tax=Datura stramonium TaxID=4076 RepID=A0ABS8T2S6_DATST|nr:hypothetical protein [Datura stramonium]